MAPHQHSRRVNRAVLLSAHTACTFHMLYRGTAHFLLLFPFVFCGGCAGGMSTTFSPFLPLFFFFLLSFVIRGEIFSRFRFPRDEFFLFFLRVGTQFQCHKPPARGARRRRRGSGVGKGEP